MQKEHENIIYNIATLPERTERALQAFQSVKISSPINDYSEQSEQKEE